MFVIFIFGKRTLFRRSDNVNAQHLSQPLKTINLKLKQIDTKQVNLNIRYPDIHHGVKQYRSVEYIKYLI